MRWREFDLGAGGPLSEDRSRTGATVNGGAKDLRLRRSLGAASWFDLLNKLIVGSSTIKRERRARKSRRIEQESWPRQIDHGTRNVLAVAVINKMKVT